MYITSIESTYSNFSTYITLPDLFCRDEVAVNVLWQSTESITIIFVAFKDSLMAYKWQSTVIHNLNVNLLNLLAMYVLIYLSCQ